MSAPALKDAPPAPVSAAAFKEAMSRVAGAVHIVTTDGPAGRAGFTATAVCSVTADPPTLLVCVNESSSVGQIFIANPTLAINTVGAAHNDLAMLFGGKTPLEERFAAAKWTEGEGGAPILEGAIAAFDCVVSQSHTVGTHRVLFCEVIGTRVAEAEALPSIYLGRGFRNLAPV
jgi:flavin reductase